MSYAGIADLYDPSRLAVLANTGLLDTPPEEAFDRLTRLAARVVGAPVAMVSLVDDHRQFLKSAIGVPEPWASLRGTPHSLSFCKHVIASGRPFLVEDARTDPRLRGHPGVEALGFVAYAGVPLVTAEGHALGSFCVADSRPRRWTEEETGALRDLAAMVMAEVGLRTEVRRRADTERALRASEEQYRLMFEANPNPMWVFDPASLALLAVNDAAVAQYGYSREEFLSMTLADLRTPETVPTLRAQVDRQRTGLGEWHDARHRRRDGSTLDVRVRAHDTVFAGRPARLVMVNDLTGQFEAEGRERESEERLRFAVRAASLGIWDWELESDRVTFLTYHAPEVRTTQAEFIASIDPRDRAEYQVRAERARREAGVFEHVFRVRGEDGEERWISGKGQVVCAADGRPMRMVGISTDVTATRQSEDALRTSEQRYRTLFEEVPVGLFRSRPSGQLLDVNPAMVRMLGYPDRETLLAIDAHVLYSDPGKRREWSDRLLAGGSGEDLQVQLRRYDGTTLCAREQIRALRGEDGEVTSYEGAIEDVSARVAAETALRSREEHFRSLIENAQDMITVLEPGGEVRYQSPSILPMLGYTPAQSVGGSVFNLVHPDDRDRVARALHTVVASDQGPQSLELRLRARDGSWRLMEMTGHARRTGDGVEVIANSRDVTERKLTERQLAQAQRMEAVGRLAGGVAHDFNNLLTVIKGNVQLLLDAEPGTVLTSDELEEIDTAADRASKLTRQLLAYSRQQVLQPCVLDLNAVVADTERMLRRLIGEDVELRTALAPDLARVRADRGQLEQVLLNLAVNARDAMPSGGRITITTTNTVLGDRGRDVFGPDSPDAPAVALRVADTGTGIPRDVLEQIFEPFFTTKPLGEGTGLGLSTVYGIVKQSGGYVWADSTPGTGSVFTVILPRVGGEHTPESDPEHRGAPGEGETVLLVEDDASVRSLVHRALTQHRYRVLTAGDGFEAERVARAFEGRIHLLLTDVVMPNRNGTEAAQVLLASRPNMRVLYMSGYPGSTLARYGVEGTGRAWLDKPFSPAQLVNRIRDVLDA
jgi:PAS domain S-box-containing protein